MFRNLTALAGDIGDIESYDWLNDWLIDSMITISLLFYSLRSNKGITLSVLRIKTKAGSKVFLSCVPFLSNNSPLSVHSATSVSIFRIRLKAHIFWLGLFLIDSCTPYGSLSHLINFAAEYSSCATEPGYAGDIGTIEIDWLITSQCCTVITEKTWASIGHVSKQSLTKHMTWHFSEEKIYVSHFCKSCKSAME